MRKLLIVILSLTIIPSIAMGANVSSRGVPADDITVDTVTVVDITSDNAWVDILKELRVWGSIKADTFASRTSDTASINDNLNLEGNEIYNVEEPHYDTGTLNSNQDTINTTFDIESNGHVEVYLDGVVQYPGEYNVTDSNTITLTETVSTETDWYVREIQ